VNERRPPAEPCLPFRGLAEGSVLNADGNQLKFSYQNNSVTLTVVRAPSPR